MVTPDTRIGWIGLGAMGAPLAGHLLAAGRSLVVFDVRPEACATLVERGAQAAPAGATVAQRCGIVFSSVPDDDALRAVALGREGVLAHAAPGTVFTDTSTVSPEASAEVARAAQERGVRYLRCALSGTSVTAQAAALTLFVSGPADAHEALRPLLACFGPKQFYVGETEQARVMKLVVNLMVGVSAAMLAEAVVLGERCGLGRSEMLDVIEASAVASPLVKYKVPLLRANDFAPQFTLALMAKDLSLITAAARAAGATVPLAALALTQYEALAREGLGPEDYMAVVKHYEQMAAAGSHG